MSSRGAAFWLLRADAKLKSERRLARVAAVAAIGVSLLLTWLLAYRTGGPASPFNHLGYVPIVLAAYLFGLRGGLFTALLLSVVLGPTPWAVLGEPEADLSMGLMQAATFIGIGVLLGYLFDHARAAANGWRIAAIEIAQRERDGMVAMARGAEAKDSDTGDHVLRVQVVAERLAIATGMSRPQAADVGWAGMLHDVGKLHVPDSILLKPAAFDADEWRIMRMHPLWGERILQDGDGFELARRIARSHHENFDGSGYPDQLRGPEIPLEARIVRIADSFDAITHRRPYHAARSLEWAMSELKRCQGRQFDPELVRLFESLVEADPAFAGAIVSADLSELRPGYARLEALTEPLH